MAGAADAVNSALASIDVQDPFAAVDVPPPELPPLLPPTNSLFSLDDFPDDFEDDDGRENIEDLVAA